MVALDGRPVEAKWWAVTRPKADHLVTVRVIPRGGGGSSGNKGWIQIAAGVVLIVVGVIFTLWGGGIGVPLIVMGVGLVIGGALTLLLPPPSLPRLKSGSGAEAPVFSITGSRNTVNQYGVICKVYGRHRVFVPDERS
jgi:predicted phage tail protein